MKIVQSLWSAPAAESPVSYTGGWPSRRHYLYSWVLSAWLAHRAYGRVELVTDDAGAELLVDGLRLPYAAVDLALNGVNCHPGLWAYGKIIAYQRQREPFLHVDADVYLWRTLPDRFGHAPLVAQTFESGKPFQFEMVYERPIRMLREMGFRCPPSWSAEGCDTALNSGIFGGHDLRTIAEYCHEVRDFVEGDVNADAWAALGERGMGAVRSINCPMEQLTAYTVARRRGAAVTPLFPGDQSPDVAAELGYTHVMGGKGGASDDVPERLERRVRCLFPAASEWIDRYTPL